MEVHNIPGNGFQEVIYQIALYMTLRISCLFFWLRKFSYLLG